MSFSVASLRSFRARYAARSTPKKFLKLCFVLNLHFERYVYRVAFRTTRSRNRRSLRYDAFIWCVYD